MFYNRDTPFKKIYHVKAGDAKEETKISTKAAQQASKLTDQIFFPIHSKSYFVNSNVLVLFLLEQFSVNELQNIFIVVSVFMFGSPKF